jgi:hypothetical protein
VDVAVQVDGDEIEVVGGPDGAVSGNAHEMVLLVRGHPGGRLVVFIVNDLLGPRS